MSLFLRASSSIAVVAAAILAGCAIAPSSTPPAPPTAPPPPAVAPALAGEQHWLEQLFAGTPVAIGAAEGGALRVEVPLKYSFDEGRAVVKPPLGAVLDKLAASLARQRRARLQLTAPSAERTEAVRSEANRGLPVFLAHGQRDGIVQIGRGIASRTALQALGHEVEWHDYPMEHSVCIEEVQALQRWLLKVLA